MRPTQKLRVRLFIALVTAAAVVATVVSFKDHPLGREQVEPLVVLLILGVVSAATLDDSTERVNYSFTSFVLVSSLPLVGPAGAAVVGAVIPMFEPKYRWSSTHLFNTALIVLIATLGGLVYAGAFHGPIPVPTDSGSDALLLRVGLPLLAADITIMAVNAILVATMMKLAFGQFTHVLAGAVRQTAPLYLGYTVLAFMFVVLWRPAGLRALSAVFIMAPLLVARWSYAQYGDELRAHNKILDTLVSASDGWDRDGTGHGRRVDQYSRLIADQVGLRVSDQRALRYASALHDIGRLGIPRSVVDKAPHERTEEERALVARHPLLAEEILSDITFLSESAHAIRCHHERPDGRGYPDGLAGEDIPLLARIIAVSDAFDALTTPGGTRPPLSTDEAIAELETRSGTQFDVRCVQALSRARAKAAEVAALGFQAPSESRWRDHDDPRSADDEPCPDAAGVT